MTTLSLINEHSGALLFRPILANFDGTFISATNHPDKSQRDKSKSLKSKRLQTDVTASDLKDQHRCYKPHASGTEGSEIILKSVG